MFKENSSLASTPETTNPSTNRPTNEEGIGSALGRAIGRRSFMKGLGVAGATLTAGSLLATEALGQSRPGSGKLSSGDTAILRFLAAAELIETDLWRQYAELGGVTSGAPNNYQLAFQQLDGDGQQYISSNTIGIMLPCHVPERIPRVQRGATR